MIARGQARNGQDLFLAGSPVDRQLAPLSLRQRPADRHAKKIVDLVGYEPAPDKSYNYNDHRVYKPSTQLIEMIESARQYQNNVQVLQTAKTLTLDTLRLGQ